MSRLEELIAELCPDGVKYMQLKDIADIDIGEFVRSDKQGDNKTYPVYNGGRTNTSKYDEYNHDGEYILISARGANAGFVNCISGKYWAGNSCYSVNVNQNIVNYRYAYHFIKNSEQKLLGIQQKGSIPAVSKKQVSELKVPVPPLEVQREIVRILDNFTFLTAELSAELSARRKQYKYYRDNLLSFSLDIPKVKLKDIATDLYRGSGIKRDQVTATGIPCVRYGEIYTKYNTWFDKCESHTQLEFVQNPKYFEHGDILFAITGESVEDIAKSVAYVGYEKCLAGGDIVVMKHNQNPRYLAHVLSTTSSIEQRAEEK